MRHSYLLLLLFTCLHFHVFFLVYSFTFTVCQFFLKFTFFKIAFVLIGITENSMNWLWNLYTDKLMGADNETEEDTIFNSEADWMFLLTVIGFFILIFYVSLPFALPLTMPLYKCSIKFIRNIFGLVASLHTHTHTH